MSWQDHAPTKQEWMDAHNEGYWWMKTPIPSMTENGYTFPEFALYEAVLILLDWKQQRLTFDLGKQKFFCDDLPSMFDTVQWEPVKRHSDG